MTAAPSNQVVSVTPGQRVSGVGQPFFGREREIAYVTSLPGDGQTRLVTLTGPGGIGKTRLAVQAATRLLRHLPDGAVFVPLALVANPSVRLSTILGAIGDPASAGCDGDPQDRLVARSATGSCSSCSTTSSNSRTPVRSSPRSSGGQSPRDGW